MIDDLFLLSGNDIPFPTAQVNIHQPTIKEIAYISEEAFFVGFELLNFNKKNMSAKDKVNLKDKSNFDIVMSIIKDKSNPAFHQESVCAIMVLTLLFPNYMVNIEDTAIVLKELDENNTSSKHYINNSNFPTFQEIISLMFQLPKGKDEQEFNPGGDMAAEIAAKIMAGRQKLAKIKTTEKVSIFSRYISILAVGESRDLNSFMNYTVYQLFDEFQRFELKFNYDLYLEAKMAGAKDLEDVDDWMKELHPQSKQNN